MEKLNKTIIRKTGKVSSESREDDGYIEADPSYLFGIMWELTKDAWAFRGDGYAEQRLQRNIANFYRRKS